MRACSGQNLRRKVMDYQNITNRNAGINPSRLRVTKRCIGYTYLYNSAAVTQELA